ncbi:MAG: 2-nitropropane dioxygenase [Flavobacteriales bacterium]|nr:2-nitropropane dioxygenase [Flavobacteriales bacterium]|tara:strand:+ start:18670 stop:19647 length:978 start_codon:yes stop_codon:yes gene_type:complete
MNKILHTQLTKMLKIDFPIIQAPMFLVSNVSMAIEAANSGITGCIPALNYRTIEDLRQAIINVQTNCDGPLGINLIVNKFNNSMMQQLDVCVELGVDYIITSLGNPKSTIDTCRPKGIKVFCDVVDLEQAKKVESLGADAIIAVNNQAGGHLGPMSPEYLIPLLVDNCSIPVISAGGVSNGDQLAKILKLGACGVSVGTPFIATHEAEVSEEYKQAIVDYGAKDIVVTDRISGSKCTIINTPYVQGISLKANWIERFLFKNKWVKKYFKMLRWFMGTRMFKKSALQATYKSVWCAGPSLEGVYSIRHVSQVVADILRPFMSEGDN